MNHTVLKFGHEIPVGPFCFTSTEARWLIKDGDRGGRGQKSEGLTTDTARKRPERPWTAARTMEVLRRCPLAIAQRLVHCAIAVSTAVLGQLQRQCPLHCCWRRTWTTRSERSPTFAAQLHLPIHGLFWADLKVQLHLPPLRSLDFLVSPGTLCAEDRICSIVEKWCLMSSDVSWHIRDKLFNCSQGRIIYGRTTGLLSGTSSTGNDVTSQQ